MLKRILFSLFYFTAPLEALQVSNPITLSYPEHNTGFHQILANEKGDQALILNVYNKREEESIQIASKTKETEWSMPVPLFLA